MVDNPQDRPACAAGRTGKREGISASDNTRLRHARKATIVLAVAVMVSCGGGSGDALEEARPPVASATTRPSPTLTRPSPSRDTRREHRASRSSPKPQTAPDAPHSTSLGDRWPLPCIRRWESGGDYQAVSPDGYMGAYQFDQDTWDGTVDRIGLDEWEGVRPDDAPAEIQDRAAWGLLQDRGLQPWSENVRAYCD